MDSTKNTHGGARAGAGRRGKSESQKVKPVQIHLYEEELAKLNAMAEKKGVKRNTLIREILERYFANC